jgi:hypothetical protein
VRAAVRNDEVAAVAFLGDPQRAGVRGDEQPGAVRDAQHSAMLEKHAFGDDSLVDRFLPGPAVHVDSSLSVQSAAIGTDHGTQSTQRRYALDFATESVLYRCVSARPRGQNNRLAGGHLRDTHAS